ncbi:MAG: alpha/beta fold hydrolase [Ignavibacteria bacterium]|nr:alpha/beta fold hydrolase [Ignavibacteria bacterium]
MKKFFVLFLLSFMFSLAKAQPVLEGDWSGSLTLLGSTLEIVTHFSKDNDGYTGKIDIPVQKAKGLPLSKISYNFPKVYFELDVPNGLAKFDGAFSSDSITGIFSQVGFEGSFYLVSGIKESVIQEKKEEVKEPVPYKEEEVTFKNGDISFAGTLTLPPYPGKHPAVVMITGSGPQNRDEEVAGFKIFGKIADHLTKNGIAVLRYDDEGVGGTTGKSVDQYTSEDFATDVEQAVKFLRSRSDINPKQIGLFGHSEGGVIAPLVASRDENIAFIICMGGTGVTGEEIILEQSRLIMKASYVPPETINKDLNTLRTMLDNVKSDKNMDEIKKTMKEERLKEYEKLSENQKSQIKNKDEWADSFVQGYVKAFSSTWMKYFIKYDPKPALEKVKCPALLLFGELDLQVPPDQNLKPMTEALKRGGNKDFESKVFIKANHLFQESTTGSPSEYGTLPKEFVSGFLDYITNWLSRRVSPSR